MYTDNTHIARVHGFGRSVSNQVHHVLFAVCNVVIRQAFLVCQKASFGFIY